VPRAEGSDVRIMTLSHSESLCHTQMVTKLIFSIYFDVLSVHRFTRSAQLAKEFSSIGVRPVTV
jgi:hypothetical protein